MLTLVLQAILQLELHLVGKGKDPEEAYEGTGMLYAHLSRDWRVRIQERILHSLAWVGMQVLVPALGDVRAVWTNCLVVRAKECAEECA